MQSQTSDPLINLRKQVYDSYDSLLNNKSQPKIEYPKFENVGELVYFSDEIEYPGWDGKSYFCGKVVSRENIGKNFFGTDLEGIVVITEEDGREIGIEFFEEYSKKDIKPVFSKGRVLIANRTSFERFVDELEDSKKYTVDEAIGLHFSFWPALLENQTKMTKKEFGLYYLDLMSKMPLFY